MTLINDMLDFSKIEAGHVDLERIDFELEDVLEEAMDLAAPKAREKNLGLMLRAEDGLPGHLLGDPARLRQILINLLGNAVKFTRKGEVVLSVSNAGAPGSGSIRFAVSDTGIGIPAGKMEAIFEDFQQADSSTTREYGGTGLGLGICRRLVERMGGKLTAVSEPGVGSTFRFTVEFGLSVAPRESASAPGDEFRNLRALVLDDNSTNRLILLERLSAWGMRCREFGAAPAEALDSLRAQTLAGDPYDIVLVDCHMDEMNGFDVAGHMHSIAPGTPVVMLSSDSQAGDVAKLAECRLAGHAVKPVRKSRLFNLIAGALDNRREEGTHSHGHGNTEHPAPQPERGLRILVAEDALNNQLLLRAYTKNTPHELTFAGDGQAAVDAFSKADFDLVLMDMRMPVMDGLSATRAIREFERIHRRAATPVIAVSANAGAADIRRSIEAGCQSHLAKPISRSRLLTAILEYAGHRPASPSLRSPQGGEEASLTMKRQEPPKTEVRVKTPELPETEEMAEIAELVPGYLRDRESDLAVIPNLLQSEDFDAIRTIGHNMKGSGLAYGLPEISRIGEVMEGAAESRETAVVLQSVHDLRCMMTNLHPGNDPANDPVGAEVSVGAGAARRDGLERA